MFAQSLSTTRIAVGLPVAVANDSSVSASTGATQDMNAKRTLRHCEGRGCLRNIHLGDPLTALYLNLLPASPFLHAAYPLSVLLLPIDRAERLRAQDVGFKARQLLASLR